MPQITVYYSVSNGGDGSAYPRWMESMELAEWDQDHMSEGWGESCTGSITFESDSPIKCLDSIKTKEGYFIDHLPFDMSQNIDDELIEFVEKFFPQGLPKFKVETAEAFGGGAYLYNEVYVEENDDIRHVARVAKATKNSGEALEKYLNDISQNINMLP